MLIYLLHQSSLWSHIQGGKRNARAALVGFMAYIAVYVILDGVYRSMGWDLEFLPTIRTGLFLAFAADVCVMGWIYKDFYGRMVTEEVGVRSGWVYDKEQHKYHYLPEAVNANKRMVQSEMIQETKDWKRQRDAYLEQQKQAVQVWENKERIWGAKAIQAWWRKIQYEPGRGRIWQEAMEEYKRLMKERRVEKAGTV